MLRIHFTAGDLARTYLASGPDPMWEVLLSLHMLTGQRRALMFREWRHDARTRVPPAARLLMHLAPPIGDSADFLTPDVAATDIDAGIDAVLRTPRRHLAAGIAQLAGGRSKPAWAHQLADGEPAMLTRLGDGIRQYYDAVLAPLWNDLGAGVGADRAGRARSMASGGIESLLSTLHPTTRWDGRILHVRYPDDRDMHLGGRGLRLVPSYFCWAMPVTLSDPGFSPVLVYPIEHRQGWMPWHRSPGQRHGALEALVGTARATVLRILGEHEDGQTTSALARHARLSPSSASEHATTLRNAGLTTTRQHGRHVLHSVTPLGRALLASDHPLAQCGNSAPTAGEPPAAGESYRTAPTRAT
jgi:DNA-binding transcriptional ArsR family regulator